MSKPLLSFWQKDGITGVGNRALLEQPRRNHWIAHHAAHIVIAEAAPGGALEPCVAQWKNEGMIVSVLSDSVGSDRARSGK